MKPQDANIMSRKLISEITQLARSYGKDLPHPEDHYQHDFAMMLGFDDLKGLSVKFFQEVNGKQVVKAEYSYNFSANGNGQRFSLDTSNGIAIVPIEPPFDMNIVITRNGKSGFYHDQLWINWSNAPTYHRPQGISRDDGHFARKTGGRGSREVFVADQGVRRTGRVKFYNPVRGFGFIIQDGTGTEIFMHRSQVAGSLTPGMQVSFIPLYATGKGIQAQAVRPI